MIQRFLLSVGLLCCLSLYPVTKDASQNTAKADDISIVSSSMRIADIDSTKTLEQSTRSRSVLDVDGVVERSTPIRFASYARDLGESSTHELELRVEQLESKVAELSDKCARCCPCIDGKLPSQQKPTSTPQSVSVSSTPSTSVSTSVSTSTPILSSSPQCANGRCFSRSSSMESSEVYQTRGPFFGLFRRR